MSATWHIGNAVDFIDPVHGVRASKDVEVEWGTHKAGEKRAEWTSGDDRTTLALLVEGRFRIDLTDTSATLTRQGDYVLWGPGIDHSWEALADSVIVTVCWPSRP